MLIVFDVTYKVHSFLQDPQNLNALFILPEHDDVSLFVTGINTFSELRTFAPQGFAGRSRFAEKNGSVRKTLKCSLTPS